MAKFHWDDYIEERRDVMLGKPVFNGTRVTVGLVLKALGAGTTHDVQSWVARKPHSRVLLSTFGFSGAG